MGQPGMTRREREDFERYRRQVLAASQQPPARQDVEDDHGPGVTRKFDILFHEAGDGMGRGAIMRDGSRRSVHWRSWDERTEGQLISIPVVGGQRFHPEELQLPDFRPGKELMLVREPDNPADPNAVAVFDADGRHQVGYIPKEEAVRVRRLVAEGARAYSVWETTNDAGHRVGLRLVLVSRSLQRQMESVMADVAQR